MNSEKILIEINVAGVNRSFDCIVPRTLPAKLLCRGFLELVEQSMGIPFGAYRQALRSARAAFFRRSRRSTTPISTAATRCTWSEQRENDRSSAEVCRSSEICPHRGAA